MSKHSYIDDFHWTLKDVLPPCRKKTEGTGVSPMNLGAFGGRKGKRHDIILL